MGLTLVVASCLLAAMILPGPAYHPLKARIANELLGNGLLVAACVAGMVALAHAARAINLPRTANHAREMVSRARGRMARLDLEAVEWIETQGNYLALHGREGTKLLRRTAKSLEAELDPRRFVRIHRRTIIAVDAVRAVSPLSAGDATVQLTGGEELRVSRSHRAQLWKALESAGG